MGVLSVRVNLMFTQPDLLRKHDAKKKPPLATRQTSGGDSRDAGRIYPIHGYPAHLATYHIERLFMAGKMFLAIIVMNPFALKRVFALRPQILSEKLQRLAGLRIQPIKFRMLPFL